jgi:RNA ligase (TIGR02306 family)
MSTFAVKAVRIRSIEPIENADAIELAVVGDYRSVVRKNEFSVGDLVIYIPEASLLPLPLLREMNLEGKLAGGEKNRVKAIKLRGCLSQGLVYKTWTAPDTRRVYNYIVDFMGNKEYVEEGQDVAEFLGITKWEPPIPVHMAGEVYNAGMELTVNYDIENIKAYPDVIAEGEMVVMTEKLHGSFCGVALVPMSHQPEGNEHIGGMFMVFSKGLGAKGLCFKDNPNNAGNLYMRTCKNGRLFDALMRLSVNLRDVPIFILGEVFGKGVQDLSYGLNDVQFRVFDIAYGFRGDQRYLDYDAVKAFCDELDIPTVPELYVGSFSKEVLNEFTNGRETVSGSGANIREGVVVKPLRERRHDELGRVILKSVSADYLLRKGDATEYN